MVKRPFLIFFAVLACLVAIAVTYIQSAEFARVVKRYAAFYLPTDMGVDGDFDDFSIKLFPPGLSVNGPRVSLRGKNILDLPAGSSVKARRIDLTFRPFQMLSGNIRVNQVTVVGGVLRLTLDKIAPARKSPRKGIDLHWSELVNVRADSIELVDTDLELGLRDPQIQLKLKTKLLSLDQWRSAAGLGYAARLELESLEGEFPKDWSIPSKFERVRAVAHVNSQGLIIDEVVVTRQGVEATAKGKIKGDLLAPAKGLIAEGDATLVGDLSQAFQEFMPNVASKGRPAGRVSFVGKVKCDLNRPGETLRAEGVLEGAGVRYQAWSADEVKLEGSYSVEGGTAEVAIGKGVISSKETKREGGHRPGGGGKIEIGSFKMRLNSMDPVTVPLKLTRAHVHWLGASALKDVYGMDFRAGGTIDVTYVPQSRERAWQVSSRLAVKMDEFQLDNQRLGKTKPMKRVLRVQNLGVDGKLVIDSSGLKPDGVTLTLARTAFQVSGKIDSKTGYDLKSFGPLDFADFGTLADVPIAGKGMLGIRVHGPASRVFLDFDADLKEASYLGLALGSMRGKLTYDEDPQLLLFHAPEFKQGMTIYRPSGRLDFGKGDSADLDIDVPKGDISDFIRIFEKQTQGLGWFPKTLRGGLSGSIRVSGGLSMDRLVTTAKVNGPNWEYAGERFRNVAIKGGYDSGRYFIEQSRAIKQAGRVQGKISIDADERMEWELRTEELTLSDFDHIARLDVPIRGSIAVSSVGKGKIGSIESLTHVNVSGMTVRGVSMAGSELFIRSEGGVLRLKGTASGGQGTLDMAYNSTFGAQNYFRAELKDFDFSPALLLLNPKSIQDKNLAGLASGAIDVTFKAGEGDRLSGKVAIVDYLLQRSGRTFTLIKPVQFSIERGSFRVDGLGLKGSQGEVSISLISRSAELDGTIRGLADLSIMEFLTPTVQQANGVARVEVGISGTLNEPLVSGKALFSGGNLRVASLDSPFENISGSLQLRQNVVSVQQLEADLSTGRVSVGGNVLLFADRYPALDLSANLSGPKLKVYPFQFVKVRGKIFAKGEDIPYAVTGAVVVESALSKEKVMSQGAGPAVKSTRFTPPPTMRQEADSSRFKLDIGVEAPGGILVQNDLFDAELKTKIRLVNTIDAPRLFGTASLVQGKIIFKDRAFQISSAEINFDNPAVINPAFSLTATTEVNGTRVQLDAAGRLEDYRIQLSSNPVLPESEIISLLALGFTSEEVRKLNPTDRTAVEQGEAASLVLHSTDFNRDLQDKTGLQIQIDEAVNTQVGTSIFRPRADIETSSAPKIVIRRQIGKKVDVSVGSTVGVGTNNQREVNAEFKVTPGFSVIGVWDTLEGADAKTRESYGVDLKLQRRFK